MSKMRYHVVIRTSPVGIGSKFVGTCSLCGQTGLKASAARLLCENPRGVTRDGAVIAAIMGGRDAEGTAT